MKPSESFPALALLLFGALFLIGCTQAVSSPAPIPAHPASPTAIIVTLAGQTPTIVPPASPTPSKQTTVEPVQSSESPPTPQSCLPTQPDQEGPFYTPGAPQRDKVGKGYILLGVVRSVDDCSPIPGAQIEFWMAGPNGEYTDEYRATMYSDENGAYRFESHFPPAYSGRPPHIHIKVSKEGFQSLTTQHYPVEATDSAAFDLVLVKLP